MTELTVDVTGSPVPASQSEVRRAMARGGAHVALQAADEMRHYWEPAFAPHREAAAMSALDAEIDRCAGVLVRHGAAALINSPHPAFDGPTPHPCASRAASRSRCPYPW